MREHVLAETANVISAKKCIAYLQQRPKTEMVGMGLLHGAPGLGKTRFARRLAYYNDYIYLRLEASMTAKSFAQQLLRLLHYRYALDNASFHGSTNKLFRRCISILQSNPDAVIIIDEIDYAFTQPVLLGSIRDIVDETIAVVVLVGMKDAREKLLRANSHYFDRCNYFYEFKRLSRLDVELVCKEISEVKMKPDLLTYIHKTTRGNIRQIIKIIEAVEKVSAREQLSIAALNDLLGDKGTTDAT
ncbi:MAG: ATP-binding protein [Candidatus Cloacimonetes bacterium]|nr:ATP-binding protein [Candidatus Cloacimonadota bacterium]